MFNKENKAWSKLRATARRCKEWLSVRWYKITPSIRYALVYLVAMVCLTSMMWWFFNPMRFLDTLPPAVGYPEAPGGLTDREDESDIPEPGPENTDEETGATTQVFALEKGQLRWPIQGRVLEPGNPFPNTYVGAVYGIHIAANQGDEVKSAWHGTVEAVINNTAATPGIITINHGQWQMVYRNLESTAVAPGDDVQPGTVLGILCAKKDYPDYASDYLDFQLYLDDAPQNPLDYLDEPEQSPS